jgi:histidinol-phosphate aminotransferase
MLTTNENRRAESVNELARESYRGIALYSATAGQCTFDLSDNTNLWGAPPSALRALSTVGPAEITRYPVAFEPALRNALADYAGVSPDMIACGCGSDDVLDCAIRAFAEPGEALCMPDPSFAMIPVFARTNGLRPVSIPLTRWLDADVDAMIETGARIIYLCSPNNPTGTAFSRKAVEQIVERAPGLVIIDQAYFEFGGDDFTDLASSGRPVLVTRTMSKAFGLAGLRVGYGIGSPELITEVLKARGPYKVSSLAERASIAPQHKDRGWVTERVNEVIANRSRFRAELAVRGIGSLESSANFVLLPVNDCTTTSGKLERGGICARAFRNLPGIGDAVRIAIGPWEMMQRCLDALTEDPTKVTTTPTRSEDPIEESSSAGEGA